MSFNDIFHFNKNFVYSYAGAAPVDNGPFGKFGTGRRIRLSTYDCSWKLSFFKLFPPNFMQFIALFRAYTNAYMVEALADQITTIFLADAVNKITASKIYKSQSCEKGNTYVTKDNTLSNRYDTIHIT